MRMVFGALALLVVVAIVGMLARTQLATTAGTPARAADAATAAAATAAGVPPATSLREQPAQIKQAVEGLMQQPRPTADDAK